MLWIVGILAFIFGVAFSFFCIALLSANRDWEDRS